MYHHTTDLQIPIIRPYIACSLICLLVWKISSLPPKIACFKLYIYVRISYILTCNQFLPVREKKFPSGVEDAPIFSSTFLPFFPITTTYTCNKQPHHKRFHHYLLISVKHWEPLPFDVEIYRIYYGFSSHQTLWPWSKLNTPKGKHYKIIPTCQQIISLLTSCLGLIAKCPPTSSNLWLFSPINKSGIVWYTGIR